MLEMKPSLFKLIVYVPIENASLLREALGQAGAGRIGNYDFASFSSRGTGRFRPLKGAKPTIGSVGKFEEVEEERIETIVEASALSEVLKALRATHPYEEPAIEILRLEDAE